MALQECGLNVNRESRELQAHGTIEFPCAGYASSHTGREGDGIAWHWHEELEIICIAEGRMRLNIPSETFVLNAGDCAVINSNVLHSAAAEGSCRLRSLVFSPALVTGGSEFAFSQKYMKPLISCSSFSGFLAPGERYPDVARWFWSAFCALERETFGYEFCVRESLSRVCLFLYRQFEAEIAEREEAADTDSRRIRRMLEYIHGNFAGDVTLAGIARAADIGERECLRCFQKTIRQSPVQYLLKYRVMRGAELLSERTDRSISEIAALCGFDSPSNFAKMFRRFYKCTPREYRRSGGRG